LAARPVRAKSADRYALEFSERLHTALKRFNAGQPRGGELTQEELAARIGKSQSAVSRWMSETNPSVPDNPTIEAIATALKVDPAWLAFGIVSE
jgi:ribosome-binding protein aMBF1 (putative translation factor)